MERTRLLKINNCLGTPAIVAACKGLTRSCVAEFVHEGYFSYQSLALLFPRTNHGFRLQTPAKSRDDIGDQGADKKDIGVMSPESGPNDGSVSKTVEEVARGEANSSSVEQGPAVTQEQRLEDPPFIQVGEKVCFSTVVKAVLIPSIEDMPQGEKNHIW